VQHVPSNNYYSVYISRWPFCRIAFKADANNRIVWTTRARLGNKRDVLLCNIFIRSILFREGCTNCSCRFPNVVNYCQALGQCVKCTSLWRNCCKILPRVSLPSLFYTLFFSREGWEAHNFFSFFRCKRTNDTWNGKETVPNYRP